ncbi:hypothetical protein AX16_005679 [Volvariella volvacea WC 439]|nr:hypothetical protein AX16_005679 [Volvariella volvacea WC 439]
MAHHKRLSQTLSGSWNDFVPSPSPTTPPSKDSEVWIEHWKNTSAKDLIDSPLVTVDAETTVEEACEKLLSQDLLCLAITSQDQLEGFPYVGLFDYSDVNAFLTLAATRHLLLPEAFTENSRIEKIVAAAKAGRVPVQLVSNLSDKNPLETVAHDANVLSLLEIFSNGAHRVLVRAPESPNEILGIVSDRGLLSWFATYAKGAPPLQEYLSNVLHAFDLPSISLRASVVASPARASVLDAMKLMSEEGVSSVAVLDDETSFLLSAVSVTDIGKIVVPSQSNQILATPLQQFISFIKVPHGASDGADKYPVYSVLPSSTLLYTIHKVLATNAHRVFVARESVGLASPSLSPKNTGNLSGIVSIVDILSVFARLAKIPVDPTRMQRHRRASSSSSQSPSADKEFFLRSRSNSRTGIQRRHSFRSPPGSLGNSIVLEK